MGQARSPRIEHRGEEDQCGKSGSVASPGGGRLRQDLMNGWGLNEQREFRP